MKAFIYFNDESDSVEEFDDVRMVLEKKSSDGVFNRQIMDHFVICGLDPDDKEYYRDFEIKQIVLVPDSSDFI